MPLSEHETHVLAQIESALCAEDPRFASTLRRARLRAWAVGWILGATLFVIGLAALISGLALKATTVEGIPILSVFGYLVMWAGAVHVMNERVLVAVKRMAFRVARWAMQDPCCK
jgi:Protein of unknown function (DUF3040)